MTPSSSPPGRRILVVDDNAAIHDDFRKILGAGDPGEAALDAAEARLRGAAPRLPFEVETASQGEEGVRLVEEAVAAGRPYALAFVDVRMPPGCDGIEATRRMWRACPDLQVVLCTAYSDTAWDQALEKLQPQDRLLVLKKPFETVEVCQLAAALFEKCRLRAEAGLKLSSLEQAVRRRTRELEESHAAALNMMADAVAARERTEAANRDLTREIAERQRAEESLKRSEEHYRLLFDHNPLPMWVHDGETLRFLAVNPAAVQAYGYSREEFLGLSVAQIRAPDDIPAGPARPARLAAEAGAGECRHRRRDGAIRRMEIVSSPMTFGGRPARLVLVSDITEKKLLEEKFLKAQRLESIGMLAAGIAHDLNNVLAPIAMVPWLLEGRLTEPADRRLLDTVAQATKRGSALVRQILGFARGMAGELRPIALKHVARETLDVISETFPKTIVIESHLASDLWPIVANSTHLHQVLLNLCVNARDAMPAGGTLHVRASNHRFDAAEAATIPGAREGAFVVLEIEDTGTGIDPAVLARMWDPFFTTKPPGKGTGLGLSTVRGIVATHQGFIAVRSAPGAGTCFRIFLPAEQAAAETAEPPAAAPPRGRGELILLVDDEKAIRDTLASTLTGAGYRIVAAADGEEGAARFAECAADCALVIADRDMPQLGGAGLAERIRALQPDLKILAISGLSASARPAEELDARFGDAFVMKPFDVGTLLTTVDRLLRGTDGAPAAPPHPAPAP